MIEENAGTILGGPNNTFYTGWISKDGNSSIFNKEEGVDLNNMKTIKIKYHNKNIEKLKYVGGSVKSNWIDLRAAETVELKKGEFKIISLGVSMELPEGYEAHIVPRSSTFKNFGVIQTNHMGVIDSSYRGDTDIWGMPVIAVRDTVIHEGDRICQFRIMKIQDDIVFEEVESLNNKSRGGFGTSGEN